MTINPASTVLTIRDHPHDGIQVLLLKRNSKLKFAPSFWVFPGGRIDPTDGPLDQASILNTAKIAAAREALEEAGLNIDTKKMTHYCHWTTPSGGKRRFATWFFHCHIESSDQVLIDESEIVDHTWLHPKDALHQMSLGKIPLLPPTFITLERLRNTTSYMEVVQEFERTGVVIAKPVTVISKGLFYCLYQGDSGYNKADITATESLHRLIINQERGNYHFEHKRCSIPPINGGAFTRSSWE